MAHDDNDMAGLKPLVSHESTIDQDPHSPESTSISPLLSSEPRVSASSKEGKVQPLRSREPTEDEYHGLFEINPGVGFSNPQSESPIFGRSVDMAMAASNSPAPLRRIESIEAKMELHDQLHRMSKQDLLIAKEKIKELEMAERVNVAEIGAVKIGVSDQMSSLEEKLRVLTMKVDKHIDEADKKERERAKLVTENEHLTYLVNELIERAEKERRELPDIKEVTRKLTEKLQSTNDKLQQSQNELKRVRKTSEHLKVENISLAVEVREHKDTIEEKDVTIRKQELLLKRFENRCRELDETNKRLKKENGYFKETKFQVRPSVNFVSSTTEAATARPLGMRNQEIGLECFSCGSCYLPSDHEAKDCKFHPLPGMHYREWKLWPVGDGVNPSDMGKLYWACCNKLSYGRPDGCCSGRHHQQWEMDITMKTVLLSKENLDWFQ